MNYSGIDLHSNNSVVVVTDEEDRVVAAKRLPNDLAKILAFLIPWRATLAGVVVESTYNCYLLVDGLQASGFDVKLSNTGPSSPTTVSSTVATKPMHVIWCIYCGWAFCPPARFCQRSSAHYAIWPGSACNWCAAAHATSWPLKTSWRVSKA